MLYPWGQLNFSDRKANARSQLRFLTALLLEPARPCIDNINRSVIWCEKTLYLARETGFTDCVMSGNAQRLQNWQALQFKLLRLVVQFG